ncbi:MAG: pyrroline-5-carboxylate reductase [Cytophagaceae bacterium]|nr:pyrroline-5-carboxylate reductase [Cytophagaceae bacterium]MDW8455401.1 pyrroline-5-carboxylate reductase [Cytophagaceae bacterium]
MKIAIIGGGNMGSTYARAFVQSNIVAVNDLLIVEKHDEKLEELKKEGIALLCKSIDDNLLKYSIIICAVKPQDFRIMAQDLKNHIHENQLMVSIMAGIKIETIQKLLSHKKVVRAMPNTPAQLGFGITAFAAAPEVSFEDISKVDTLLETTGKSIFMKDEMLLDAVTALSGSGPAYFYYIVKHMIEAGKQMGIEEPVAAMLVKQTMLGSFQIMNNSKSSLDDMIKAVASKGGTTEAALRKFEEYHLGQHIIEALKAAEQRAKELSLG